LPGTAVLKSADTIIMETHGRFIGADKTRLMMDKLAGLGFRLVEETEIVVVLRQQSLPRAEAQLVR
jgi:hypothetical protein